MIADFWPRVCLSLRVSLRRSGRWPGFEYLGSFAYCLTMCTFARTPHFVDSCVVEHTHGVFCDAFARWGFELLAYCSMPDHAHMLVSGRDENANLKGVMHDAKQRTGFWHSRTYGKRLWQDSYFDHIVRDEESLGRQACYILNNPVRAGLVNRWDLWKYSGTTLSIADEEFQRYLCASGGP